MNLLSDFQLLGKLSSTEQSGQIAFQHEYEELFSVINHELAPLLEASDYKGKSTLKAQLDSELKNCQLILRYPTLASRTTLGIFPGRNREGLEFMKHLSYVTGHPLYARIRNLPSILYHSSDGEDIFVTNNAGNVIRLSVGELEEMLLLYKNKIKVEDILWSCAISETLRFPNINFVLFPPFANRHASDYKRMLDFCGTYFLFYSDLAERNQIPDSVIASKGSVFIVHLPEHTEACQKLHKELIKSYPALTITILPFDDINEILQTFDRPVNNCVFCETFLSNVLRLEVSQNSSEIRHENNVAILAKDSFDQEAEGVIKDTLKNLRDAEVDAMENAKIVNNRIKKIRKDLVHKTITLKNLLLQFSEGTISRDVNPILLRAKYGDVCGEIILSSLELKDYPLAQRYVFMFDRVMHPYSYLYKLYYECARGEELSQTYLKKLGQATANDEIVIRGKIRFATQLQISDQVRNQLAFMLKSESTDQEMYYKACHVERTQSMDEACKLYWDAFQMGNCDAGRRLAEYYEEQKNYRELKKCADRLIPEAALMYAKNCTADSQRYKKVIYLHIAVALEYEPAIKYYANNLYNELVERDIANKKIPEKQLRIATGLYKYMMNRSAYGSKTRFGVLLYLAGNYQAAKPYLENGKEGKYYLGKMYAEGHGVSKDRDKAMRYLNESEIAAAQNLYNKLFCEKKKEEKNARQKVAQQYNSSSSYHSTSSNYSSSSDGDCFITTATCQAEGKSGNCDELMAFRKYRDETLLNTQMGKALVEEYYRIAPGIVECIQNDPKRDEIYQHLFIHYIAPGYELLSKGEGDMAQELYCEAVLALAKRYNIQVSLGKVLPAL